MPQAVRRPSPIDSFDEKQFYLDEFRGKTLLFAALAEDLKSEKHYDDLAAVVDASRRGEERVRAVDGRVGLREAHGRAQGQEMVTPGGTRAGYFEANVNNLSRRPKYAMETLFLHEGVPGHYMQLALAWAHENPIRRQYYDSGAQEGIGFYAEEVILQAGPWADSPRSRGLI